MSYSLLAVVKKKKHSMVPIVNYGFKVVLNTRGSGLYECNLKCGFPKTKGFNTKIV